MNAKAEEPGSIISDLREIGMGVQEKSYIYSWLTTPGVTKYSNYLTCTHSITACKLIQLQTNLPKHLYMCVCARARV